MANEAYAEASASISPDGPVQVGAAGSWSLTFTMWDDTLPPGAAIRISIPHGFTAPQIDSPDAPGYVRASASNPDVRLVLSAEPASEGGFDPFKGSDGDAGILVVLDGEALRAEESVSVTYGVGTGAAHASAFCGPARFRMYVCREGGTHRERFVPLAESPALMVSSGGLRRLEVIAPSSGEAGGDLSLCVVGRDALGNRCVGWSGWFSVESDTENLRVPAVQRHDDPNGEGVRLVVGLPDGLSGPVRLRVRESETGLVGTSNPVLVGQEAPFWGDPHAATAEEGRPHSTLDFSLDVGPGPTLDQTSFLFHLDKPSGMDRQTSSAPGLLRIALPDAKQVDEMLPSHLLEIYSSWGSREFWGGRRPDVRPSRHPDRTVHAVLSQGIAVGLAAGSNSRFGVGGDARRAEAGRGYPAGLTGVYAESLTREALFAAMRERRCYATTGARILLRFEVDGHDMGQLVEIDPDDRVIRRERHVAVRVHGTSLVDRIEIVRNNADVCTYRGESEDVSFDWTDQQPLERIALPRTMRGGALTCYYFARVTQIDGEIAWSSPIWFTMRP